MWVKFEVDWSNGATCIDGITDKHTDRQTVKRTYLPNFFEILASNKKEGKYASSTNFGA